MHEISKEMALRDFRSGFSRLLITTDLLILYKYMTVSLVICYEFPIDAKTYLHR